MEAALALTRGVPRAYLLPSPQQRQADAQLTFRPQITQKSKVTFLMSLQAHAANLVTAFCTMLMAPALLCMPGQPLNTSTVRA